MKIFEKQQQLKRVHNLIKRKATGCPKVFANKLAISIRTLYRILDELKSYGLTIKYSKKLKTYYYDEKRRLIITFKVLDGKGNEIYGE